MRRRIHGTQADVPDLPGPADAAAEAKQHAPVRTASGFASDVPPGQHMHMNAPAHRSHINAII